MIAQRIFPDRVLIGEWVTISTYSKSFILTRFQRKVVSVNISLNVKYNLGNRIGIVKNYPAAGFLHCYDWLWNRTAWLAHGNWNLLRTILLTQEISWEVK